MKQRNHHILSTYSSSLQFDVAVDMHDTFRNEVSVIQKEFFILGYLPGRASDFEEYCAFS